MLRTVCGPLMGLLFLALYSGVIGCLLIFLDPFVYTPFKIIQELIVSGIQHTCRKITKRERDKRAPHREKSKFRLY